MSSGKVRVEGQIKWFDSKKGYGFIRIPGADGDIFVHVKQLRQCGINRDLIEGEKVSFSTDQGPKGQYAVEINVIEGES